MTATYATDDGDSVKMTGSFGPAQTLDELDSAAEQITECGNVDDRSLIVEQEFELTVTSGLAAEVEVRPVGGVYSAAMIEYSDGPSCVGGTDSIHWDSIEPGETVSFRMWVAGQAITPQDPTGADFSFQSSLPGVSLAGGMALDKQAWGPRVMMCDVPTLWLAGAEPRDPNYLSGSTSPCTVIESP